MPKRLWQMYCMVASTRYLCSLLVAGDECMGRLLTEAGNSCRNSCLANERLQATWCTHNVELMYGNGVLLLCRAPELGGWFS